MTELPLLPATLKMMMILGRPGPLVEDDLEDPSVFTREKTTIFDWFSIEYDGLLLKNDDLYIKK